jgi:2-hydroxychromene-2-carboxylate isomerase
MAKPKINLYFDPVSPFSYMAMWALEVSSASALTSNETERVHLADRN